MRISSRELQSRSRTNVPKLSIRSITMKSTTTTTTKIKTTTTTTPPSPSKGFTSNYSSFARRPKTLRTDTVYLLRPPRSAASDSPWITSTDSTAVLRHPLTSKPHSFKLPPNLHPSAISRTFHFPAADHTLAVPAPQSIIGGVADVQGCTLLSLSAGGELVVSPRLFKGARWLKLTDGGRRFDDLAVCGGRIYAVDRQGEVNLINNCYETMSKLSLCETLTFASRIPGLGLSRFRNRFAVDGGRLYLVVRMTESSFRVYRMKKGENIRTKTVSWEEVREFEGNKVLFMARAHYFFREALENFPGKEFKNCIVFSEAAFPQYGEGGWEFTLSAKRFGAVNTPTHSEFKKPCVVRRCEDDIAVFRLGDRCFGREGENTSFPKINWSPPSWVFRASSVPDDEFKGNSEMGSSSQSEREIDEDENSDSGSSDENDGEARNQGPEVVEIDSDSNGQHPDKEVVEIVESDSDIQNQEDGKMQQCDSNNREKKGEEMHSKANIRGDASLQDDIVMVTTPSLSATEEEVTNTLLSMNSEIDVTEKVSETSDQHTTHSMPKACTSSTTESHKADSSTTKFEGLDIRSDLVPTLQKIWQKHGNIIKDSIVRSGDLLAKALESLATIVRMLEDNSAQSMSDCQAEYLSSTISDLKCIRFQVHWLNCFVEKALKIHKSKALVESLNDLS